MGLGVPATIFLNEVEKATVEREGDKDMVETTGASETAKPQPVPPETSKFQAPTCSLFLSQLSWVWACTTKSLSSPEVFCLPPLGLPIDGSFKNMIIKMNFKTELSGGE